jgi:hypothetical protein
MRSCCLGHVSTSIVQCSTGFWWEAQGVKPQTQVSLLAQQWTPSQAFVAIGFA